MTDTIPTANDLLSQDEDFMAAQREMLAAIADGTTPDSEVMERGNPVSALARNIKTLDAPAESKIDLLLDALRTQQEAAEQFGQIAVTANRRSQQLSDIQTAVTLASFVKQYGTTTVTPDNMATLEEAENLLIESDEDSVTYSLPVSFPGDSSLSN